MKLSELKRQLEANASKKVRFVGSAGNVLVPQLHVTEVARIDKRFIDCGGTFRSESSFQLQLWQGNDTEHRLAALKLAGILDKASPILGPDDLEVEVEHEVDVITRSTLDSVEATAEELLLKLGERHTACLAIEKCAPKPSRAMDPNILTYDFRAGRDPSGCCSS